MVASRTPPFLEPRMNSQPAFAKLLPIAILLAIAAYLLAFHDVPIFYDEAAFRRVNGRALIDGFVQFAVFPECLTPKAVGWVFVPAHALLSWLDGRFGWSGVRLFPTLFALTLVGVTAAMLATMTPKRWVWAVLVFSGGFVGLAGTSMVMSRPEAITTLHVALCILTWLVGRKMPAWPIVALVVGLHLVALNLSLFVHQQALVVAPFSLLSCGYLLRHNKRALALVGVGMVVMLVAAVPQQSFSCPEDPALEQLVARTHGVVLSNQLADQPLVMQAASRLWLFIRQFPFLAQEAFSIPVPQVPEAVAIAATIPVGMVVTLNLLVLVAAATIMTVVMLRENVPRLIRRDWRAVGAVFFDGRAIWTAAALAVLAYSAYDLGGLFYRAYFRNLLTVLVLAIGVAGLVETRPLRWMKALAVLSGVTCVGSMFIAWQFLAPQLAAGYQSYYVSLVRDWPAFDQRVRDVAAQCAIGPADEHVVVDMATYQAMRQSPRPLDFNYVWYREYLEGTVQTRSESEWKDFYRQYSASGYVVMCRTLTYAPMSVQAQDGELCCAHF